MDKYHETGAGRWFIGSPVEMLVYIVLFRGRTGEVLRQADKPFKTARIFERAGVVNVTQYALENSGDLEDTLQCFYAKKSGCDILLTGDKKFMDCGIKIFDYDAFSM